MVHPFFIPSIIMSNRKIRPMLRSMCLSFIIVLHNHSIVFYLRYQHRQHVHNHNPLNRYRSNSFNSNIIVTSHSTSLYAMIVFNFISGSFSMHYPCSDIPLVVIARSCQCWCVGRSKYTQHPSSCICMKTKIAAVSKSN